MGNKPTERKNFTNSKKFKGRPVISREAAARDGRAEPRLTHISARKNLKINFFNKKKKAAAARHPHLLEKNNEAMYTGVATLLAHLFARLDNLIKREQLPRPVTAPYLINNSEIQ